MHTYLRLGLGFVGFVAALCSAFASAPVIQRSDAVGITLGQAVEYHVVAVGQNTVFSAAGLPAGVTINSATGLIKGAPAEVGQYPVKVTATNGDGSSAATITISVVSPDAGPLIYAPLFFDAYQTGQPGGDSFTCTLKATGSPTGYEVTDPLPASWSFNSGTFVGRTSQPGVFVIPVNATNVNGVGSAAITIRVHPACTEMQQTTGSLLPGDVFKVSLMFNRAVSFGGEAPYLEFHTYPDGQTKKLQYLSGNGTAVLEFGYTVTASDSPGDILLYTAIQPAAGGAATALADPDGLAPGSSLPIAGSYTPVAKIIAPTVSSGGSTVAAPTGSATPTTTSAATATPPATSTTTPSTVATTVPEPTSTAPATSPTVTPTTTTQTVTPTPTGDSSRARLVNLSARAAVTEGDANRSFIAGFVVSGSAPKRMLLRAVGPSLAEFGVSNSVSNPRLRVYDASGRVVNENEDWSSGDTSSVANAVGAFGLSAGSRDAAIAVTLAPGTYSMHVIPAGGNGVALAEIYDADTSSGSAPLVNISTRAHVEPGDRALVAGFVVAGSEPKRVLIRGVGPALGAYGVGGALSDPSVTVYQNGNVVARNDNWQTGQSVGSTQVATSSADIAAAATAVGAFPLPAGSNDAALVATLAPGSYSAVVSPANGASGAGLVEVYELPAGR